MPQKELLEKIGNFERLSQDIDYRKQFIQNPLRSIQQAFPEFSFHPNTQIILHENNAGNMHMILLPEEEAEHMEDSLFDDEDSFEQLIERALNDPNFRKALIADPIGVLEKELPDHFIPEDFRIHFYENSDKEIHLLLPEIEDEIPEDEDEMDDDELEIVSGGGKKRGKNRKKGPHIGRRRGGKGPRCRKRIFFK